MTAPFDPDFRPSGYFRPQRLEQYLLSNVKGAVVRTRLRELFDAGAPAEFGALLREGVLDDDAVRSLERLHPMFMGGNYLPDTEAGEVEIARLRIASTTFDVTCVYARQLEGTIHYRVVDEYDGDMMSGPAVMTATRPLSLGELHDFFVGAWSFHEVLNFNFEGDLEGMLGFFTGESDFYPDFDALCRDRVRRRFGPVDTATDGKVD